MLHLLVVLCAALTTGAGRARGRQLQQAEPQTALYVANLTFLQEHRRDCSGAAADCPYLRFAIPEFELPATVKVKIDGSAPVLYGTHELAADQVKALFEALDDNLVRLAWRGMLHRVDRGRNCARAAGWRGWLCQCACLLRSLI